MPQAQVYPNILPPACQRPLICLLHTCVPTLAALQVSPEGEVLQVLMDPTGGHVSHVSAVTEHRGRLFLGNLAKDYVSVLDLTAVQAAGADVAAAAAATDVQ